MYTWRKSGRNCNRSIDKRVILTVDGRCFRPNLSAMNALNIYLSTCRYVMQMRREDEGSWVDLYRFLPYLRQALTCCVCGGILRQPTSPVNVKSCQHHVCKSCIGGKMKVRPSCSWCKDWEQFVENIQLRILLQCFKELCRYLSESPIYHELTTSHLGEKFKISTILQDGLNIEDYKYPAKNKFANISNWPLPHFTFLAPSSSTISSSNRACVCPEKPTDAETSVNESDLADSKQSESEDRDVSSSLSTSDTSCEPVHKSRRVSAPDFSQRLLKNDQDSIRQNSCQKAVKNPAETGEDVAYTSSDIKSAVVSESEDSKVGDSHVRKAQNLNNPTKRVKHVSEPTRKGCRCGTANIPNKLTCYCQRCPCYSQRQGCFGCKCRGCRNPYNKKKPAAPVDSSALQEVNVET